ncbi:MAG TPA: hypothetical protein DD791_12745 [Syntrophomonas sp.]|jgi:hypothetical protein|nr:hypothetical protein [Syntrophomonas sp.]
MSAFTDLYSFNNLKLAWQRIRTGQNTFYKSFYRHTYDAYAISLEKNLQLLSDSIRTSVFQPSSSERIFIPKNNGLQRPITLLCIEDQIVLQAIANIYAIKFRSKRKLVYDMGVCSNRLNRNPSSIFFYERWQDSWQLFKKTVFSNYDAGFRYVADFDLSAFFDTISHDLIVKQYAPKSGNKDFCDFVKVCLKTWTPENYTHGIPQGPNASSFLAECVLLPIDKAFENSVCKYVRYVDDIRIMGKSYNDVHNGVVNLDTLCRARGLIPHSGKFGIKQAKSRTDALGSMPSLSYSEDLFKYPVKTRKIFYSSLTNKKDHIRDPSRFKYILYRSNPDEEFLRHALRLIPRHPELIDTFAFYLSRFGQRRKITNQLIRLLKVGSPFEYIEGNYWLLLASSSSQTQIAKVIYPAINRHKQLNGHPLMICIGIYNVLNESKDLKVFNYLCKSLKKETMFSIRTNVLAKLTPKSNSLAFRRLIKTCLQDSSIDVAVLSAWYIGYHGLPIDKFKVDQSSIAPQALNILISLGIVKGKGPSLVGSLGILVSRRLNLKKPWSGWKRFLSVDYKHCHRLFVLAEKAFDESPTTWMGCMDSFNDLVIRHLLEQLSAKYPSLKIQKTISKNGELIDFGVILQPGSYLERNEPNLHKFFNNFHLRRNKLPTSHAKDKKTQAVSRALGRQERNEYVNTLKKGYNEFFKIVGREGL